jgi:hypothetical protein
MRRRCLNVVAASDMPFSSSISQIFTIFRLRCGQIALRRPQEQLCCRHAHPRHTESAKRTSTTATAAQRKNVYCERRGRGSSPIGRRCSMSKAPNEAQGPRCQSPSALLRPSGEKTLDAVQHDLVVIGLHEQRPRLTQLSRILDRAPWRS